MSDTALATTNPSPALLTNAKIYREGADQLGVATVEIPSFSFMNETISGFGIAGEIEMPVAGHFGSMTMKITWNTVNDDAASLLEPKAHHLDIRASVQEYDSGTGTFIQRPVKILVQAIPKSTGVGKLEPAKKMEGETELEITYLKLWINGQERIEFDKFNFIFSVNGEDKLAGVRENMGM